MNKLLARFYCMVLLVIMGLTVFQFFSSDTRLANVNGLSRTQAAQIAGQDGYAPQYPSGFDLMAGICALLLVGYLYWFCYRKFQRDSIAELSATGNSLYNISVASGRTEYDLFHMSAEGWSVSGERVDYDFKRYMADQVVPHYVQDFVRKNQEHIDESLVEKREATPTSWSDWAKALLVFPGSVVVLFSMVLCFG